MKRDVACYVSLFFVPASIFLVCTLVQQLYLPYFCAICLRISVVYNYDKVR